MRFSIEHEGNLVRVTMILRRLSGKSAKQSLRDIKNGLGRDARVLLDVAEAGHLNASEIASFIKWLCEIRASVENVAVYTRDRSFLALLELVCGHHVVKVAQDEMEAMRFLQPDAYLTTVARTVGGAAKLVQSL